MVNCNAFSLPKPTCYKPMPTTSILHISDLHRSKGTEISNAALLSSLIDDYECYTRSETPRIKAPDLVIVSGDIIRGSTSTTRATTEVSGQYDEAIAFLEAVCKHFLGGDKSRMVIVPGNHDVDWKFSHDSMMKLDPAKVLDAGNVKAQILKDAINHQAKIRWSWKDISFYEITDNDMYLNRLKSYSDFYSRFYEGKRVFSLNSQEQFDIFDYPQFNITIVAFSSCYCNDHLRLAGDIHPDCIANANMKLREFKKKGRLILATWHHNTKGLPYDSNYMDASKLKNFISSGISLGFHGHQHKTELIHEYSDVFAKKKIVVFSAGTLCGGPNELPPGNNRQYNLIEIKEENAESVEVTLHVREKTDTSSFDNPIWTAGNIDSQLISHYSVRIDKPKGQELESVLIDIESLMKRGKFEEAKSELLKLPFANEFVRMFLLRCIIESNDFELAFKKYLPPLTDEECLTLLNYAIQYGTKEERIACVDAVKVYNSSSSLINELKNKLEALLK